MAVTDAQIQMINIHLADVKNQNIQAADSAAQKMAA